MRFDRFMEAALHDPERGYYARRIRDVGIRGDFSTTPSLSGTLGRAIGAWAAKALRETGCRDLIELGPGSGALAHAVISALPWHRRLRTRVHLVETSSPLRERQQALLGRSVHWHQTLSEALATCGGRACIYSNEFVDAFPVRRFRLNADRWEEQFVTPGRSHWNTTSELPSGSVFSREWADGQVVEVHSPYRKWMEEHLTYWKRGRMLTIDYGDQVADLYHRRPDGTLRGYFHHQLVTGPEILDRPGHQDLTCDVNFTDLIEWSAPRVRMLRLIEQSDFLKPHVDFNQPTDAFVSAAHGAGGAFLCLEQEVV
ncbi:SAM-dependent methyltransferase [Haloferula rosea]|uniref:SAM-dependent methyltransferase n=2 Tax=Haloferula rosea TaxID=490093 RepID=A0A934RAT5_9BACT|nr:SAM-dependent methyltransferase [Haloferula rosea]